MGEGDAGIDGSRLVVIDEFITQQEADALIDVTSATLRGDLGTRSTDPPWQTQSGRRDYNYTCGPFRGPDHLRKRIARRASAPRQGIAANAYRVR